MPGVESAVFGAVILAFVVLILLLTNDDGTATTTEPSTTTTGFDQLDTAVWPDPGSRTRFDSPLLLAASYAEDYLDLDDAVVGDFQRGDSRSGEVEIRSPESNEAVTTVLARQLGPDDDWFVIGSVSAAIVLDQPEALEAIDSPVTVSGQAALACDGDVSVELRAHETSEPLATDSMTVASGGPVPYRFELAWSSDADWAQVVVVTALPTPGLSSASPSSRCDCDEGTARPISWSG